jgi:hypothetical protein
LFALSIFSIAPSSWSMFAFEASIAVAEQDRGGRVVGLGEHRDLALELRVEEVLDALQLAAGLLDVVADARRARLPRERVLALRVVVDRLEVVDQVGEVRDVLLVDRLDVVEAHPARGHVVGQRHDVAADRLPGLQLLADLPEELEVVVDLLDVLDLAAVLLVELLEDLLVDVERPVGEGPVADRGLGVADARVSCLSLDAFSASPCTPPHAASTAASPLSASPELPARPMKPRLDRALAFEEFLEGSLDPWVVTAHSLCSLATTKVWWGFQVRSTSRPGPNESGSEPSRFWAKTVSSSPPSALITYWIEVPRKAATTTVPRRELTQRPKCVPLTAAA